MTEEHRQAEHDDHECSLCHAELDLAALDDHVMVAAGVSDDERDRLRRTAAQAATGDDDDDDDADVVDALSALEQEVMAAEEAVAAIEVEVAAATTAQRDAATSAAVAEDALSTVQQRQQAEINLARAQGALESLTATSDQDPGRGDDGPVGAVLKGAKGIVDKWLKKDQDPILAMISEEIARLAREFGIDNLERVALKGNANLAIWTGGAEEGYGSISGGERIRLKIATAIALMRVGKREGVGRHPGLLFIDSPASEEIGEADLSQMLGALVDVATEADVQLFVATAHTALLTKVLPPANVRTAQGDDYVW